MKSFTFLRSAATVGKPSLRERTASLKASASRVIRSKVTDGAPVTPAAALAADPILPAIAETRRLHTERTRALNVDLPAGETDPSAEQNAATDAFFAHVNDVLLKTIPTTAAGCAALARYAGEFLQDEGYALDEDQGNEQHVRILDLIARSPLLNDAVNQSDAYLLALGAQWKAADAVFRAALSYADKVERAASIDPPAVLFVQPGDEALGIARYANSYRGDEGSWYSIAAGPPCAYSPTWQSGGLRKPMSRLSEITTPRSTSSPAIALPRFEERPWPEAQARADEICAAFEKWKAEDEAAMQAAGVPELEAETDALSTEVARLEDEISAATATTIKGLKLQAEVALANIDNQSGKERAWAIVRALLKVV